MPANGWKKVYQGFESANDLEQDIYEAISLNEGIFPEGEGGEWLGDLTITITYKKAEDDAS